MTTDGTSTPRRLHQVETPTYYRAWGSQVAGPGIFFQVISDRMPDGSVRGCVTAIAPRPGVAPADWDRSPMPVIPESRDPEVAWREICSQAVGIMEKAYGINRKESRF